ncbi:MAG: cysteine-rich repeat protein [Bradymonadia bacterium]
MDGICDDEDNCLTTRNPGQEDADDDLIGDLCDACFGDNAAGDRDADLYCGAADCDDSNPRVHVGAPELCDGLNNDCVDGLPAAELDDDEDGSPNCNDLCIGRDGFGDIDRDGFCGDIDLCDGDDALGDLDEDGVCEDLDQCEGDDESGDDDLDGVCTDLDVCLGDDASGDADTDGVCDDSDLCEGDDTSGDSDDDGVCDAIDICFGDDATRDADEDGVCGDRDCRDDRTDTRPPSPAGAAGIEVCDGVDQNCDGIVDDNPEALCSIGAVCAIGECTSLKPCYADIDNDGFGDANNVILVEQGADCPNRRVLSGTDCDDSPLNCGAACGPGLQEACDGFDNDCSGLVDDTAPSCPDDENGVGTCSDGTCSLACSEGWQEVGESCLDVNECDAGPCGVDELCTNLDGGFECACAIGFAGDDGCRAVCGDSLRVSTEECDDGNATGGDGCSADCTAEQGWTCTTGCTEDCGDGLLVGFEACDDGNSNEGDGCSSACAVETNYECSGAPSACVESQLCGNGVLDVGEDCDDANFWEDDGCLADCTVDEGYTCDDGPNGWSECVESEPQSGSADDGGCASTRAARFHWWTVLAGLILLRRRQLPNQAAVE